MSAAAMRPKVLVAGSGNIFCGDDGFGPEVVRRLTAESVPEGVVVRDYGVGGVHLAYDLLEGYDLVVLVDAVPRGGEPGTLRVIEVDADDLDADDADPTAQLDAHGMDPATVFASLSTLGGEVARTLVVGVEPSDVTEHFGLSVEVDAAVPAAVAMVRELVTETVAPPDTGVG
jgi:hydrogenase maturation protease